MEHLSVIKQQLCLIAEQGQQRQRTDMLQPDLLAQSARSYNRMPAPHLIGYPFWQKCQSVPVQAGLGELRQVQETGVRGGAGAREQTCLCRSCIPPLLSLAVGVAAAIDEAS